MEIIDGMIKEAARKQRGRAVVCALLVSVFVVPVAQAGGQRSPVAGRHDTTLQQKSAFANLGHEGSGRHSARKDTVVNAFANLGHEGGGLTAAFDTAKLRPWAT
jgi:hypothetical protein